jgi:hypothetical protein
MSGMTYEQRKRAIFEFLYRDPGGLLHRYRLPEHLSDDAIRDEVNLLVEDINHLIPNETIEPDLRLLFPEINTALRRRHGAQGWPPAKVFIAATEDALEAAAKRAAASKPARSVSLDPFEIIAGKMRAKEPVGDTYFWGRQAVELIARGLVDQATMEGYRLGAFMARKEQYGEEEAVRWEAAARDRHISAKEAYHQRKDDGRAIDPEILRRMQADLDAAGDAIDRRSHAMCRSA